MASEPVRADDPTIGRLVNDATKDISTLLRKEIELAKSEIKVSVKFGVTGAIFFVVAGFLALLAVIMLSVAFAYLINWKGHGLALQWGFLIVTFVYFALAGLLVLLGIKRIKNVGAPERAIAQGKQIPSALKGQSDSTAVTLSKR